MKRAALTLGLVAVAACTPSRRRTPDDTLVVVIETAMSTADPRYAIIGYDRKLAHLVAIGLTVVDSPTLEAALGLAERIAPAPGIAWDVDPGAARLSDGTAVTVADLVRAYPPGGAIAAVDPIAASRDGPEVARFWLAAPGELVLDRPVIRGRAAVAAAELARGARVARRDDLAYDVSIRPDAKFSDGYPVTSADVAGTYGYLLDPKTQSLFHTSLSSRFVRVVITGPRAVRFHLHAPLATFKSDIDFGIVSFRRGTPEPGATIGAGPYMVREITSRRTLLDVNPHYHGVKPRIPHVEIRHVADGSARLLMLVGGSADLVQNAMRLDLVDEVRDRPRVRLQTGPSVFLTYLMFNTTDPVLADRRVRQAIALAIDRPAIIAAKFGGRAQLATGLLPPAHWAYASGLRSWDYDPARAKALLDEAGLRDPDGDGPRPRLSLVYKTSSDAFRVALARVVAAQLSAVGIDVEVRSFEFQTFFADVKKGTYQLASMQTAEVTEPDFYFTYFHSSWIPSAKNPDGYNRWRYVNPEVDRLVEAGRRELDLAKRKRIYAEVQHIIAEDVPIVALYHEDNVVLTNVDVEGYTITPNARFIGFRDATKRARE